MPRPASGPDLGYFRLTLHPGQARQTGAIELRNPTTGKLRITLAPVNGLTIDTLGSTYASTASRGSGSTRWLRIGRRAVTLAPGQSTAVPVSVLVPPLAKPGDYLSGVSVEALDQPTQGVKRQGVSIASVVRYAIGVEVSLPGPRRPALRFTGAALQRQPAGLTFLLLARNSGNVILQDVAGSTLITSGRRVVADVPLGPGTFVTRTSIAYPILTPRQRPPQGTVYRVRAYLRYAGGIARLDTLVRFGRAAAISQQAYGGPKAPGASSGLSAWLVALVAVVVLVGAVLALGPVIRLYHWRSGMRSPLRTLDAALETMRRSGEPLSLITVAVIADEAAAGKLGPTVRARLRQADRLCRLSGGGFLVVAPDTDLDTAEALAADLRRHVERPGNHFGHAAIEVHCPDGDASGAEMLRRISKTMGSVHVLTPSG